MTHPHPASAPLARPGAAPPAPCPDPAARPWAPISDAEWAALAPLLPRSRIRDLRHRMNCILAVAAHGVPWVPAGAEGPFWPTLYRHFHRWARAGVWAWLHGAAGEAAAPPALRALGGWLAALHRRAGRILARAVPQFLKTCAPTRPNPLAMLAFPPPGRRPALSGLSRILPNLPELSPFEPISAAACPTQNPMCPEAFRPLAGWPGGAGPLRPSLPCHPPHPAAVCRNGDRERAA